MEETEALKIKDKIESAFLRNPSIVGVGVRSHSPSKLMIYVEKLSPDLLKEIPTNINGLPVSVVETGKIYAVDNIDKHRIKYRPLISGISIGESYYGTGTIGCMPIDNVTKQRVILSNNHVLAERDIIQKSSGVYVGFPIIQPGPNDGGTAADKVAGLYRWVKLDEDKPNLVDCAIAKLDNQNNASTYVLGIGNVTTYSDPVVNETIRKSGRTSGLTEGQIIDVNATVKVDYDGPILTLKDQITSTVKMIPGDSGSCFINKNNNVVGLGFAGNSAGNFSVANKISNVLKALNISLDYVKPSNVKKTNQTKNLYNMSPLFWSLAGVALSIGKSL